MSLRATRDLFAILITSLFLIWVLASAFVPLILHVQFYGDKGQTIVALDALAAVLSVIGYLVVANRLPRIRVTTK